MGIVGQVSVLTLVAGSLLTASVLGMPPSFVTQWRTVVPYQLLLPWATVNALPARAFRLYGAASFRCDCRPLRAWTVQEQRATLSGPLENSATLSQGGGLSENTHKTFWTRPLQR